jgi:hypothetical protein
VFFTVKETSTWAKGAVRTVTVRGVIALIDTCVADRARVRGNGQAWGGGCGAPLILAMKEFGAAGTYSRPPGRVCVKGKLGDRVDPVT